MLTANVTQEPSAQSLPLGNRVTPMGRNAAHNKGSFQMSGNRRNGEQPVPASVLPLASLTAEDWAKACATAGYTVDENGNAVIGISGDTGDGYLVSIAVPTQVDTVNLCRALLSHALRVGQQGIKASKTPDRDVATKAANSAVNGTYSPSRDRSVDIAEREAERMFEDLVNQRVREAKPDATDDDVQATLKKMAESENGKAKIAEFKKAVLAAGTYKVSRKGKGTGSEIAITL